MNDDTLWILAKIASCWIATTFVFNLFVQWRHSRAKKAAKKKGEWASDETVFERVKYYKQRGIGGLSADTDLSTALDRALAREDYDKQESLRTVSQKWSPALQWLLQLPVVYYAYQAYGSDNVKLFVLLALLFLWRSLKYWNDVRTIVQLRILELLHMAHPTAKKDFFESDHCVRSHMDLFDRSYKLLKADGYYDEKKAKADEPATSAN